MQKSKIFSTILFIPLLYLLGWLLASPLLAIGVEKAQISLIGTVFTFILFIISMPKWFEIRWGLQNTWIILGINKVEKEGNRLSYSFDRMTLSNFSDSRKEF